MKHFIFAAVVLTALCLFTSSTNSQQTYTVTNSSGMVITGVSLSPRGADTWGSNVNTTGSIMSDQSFQFVHTTDKSNCLYDIRYSSEDGTFYYVRDVDLCNTTTVSLTRPDNLRDDMR
jgi:hypothetical protein